MFTCSDKKCNNLAIEPDLDGKKWCRECGPEQGNYPNTHDVRAWLNTWNVEDLVDASEAQRLNRMVFMFHSAKVVAATIFIFKAHRFRTQFYEDTLYIYCKKWGVNPAKVLGCARDIYKSRPCTCKFDCECAAWTFESFYKCDNPKCQENGCLHEGLHFKHFSVLNTPQLYNELLKNE